jgi:hypothetical protein
MSPRVNISDGSRKAALCGGSAVITRHDRQCERIASGTRQVSFSEWLPVGQGAWDEAGLNAVHGRLIAESTTRR